MVTDYRESQDILLRRTNEFDRSMIVGDQFSFLLPKHHIRLLTNKQFKSQRLLIRDLMTPAFLNDIAAPQIYDAAQNLVAVWKEKARLAKGHPFSANDDLYNAILDGLWAFTFGLKAVDGVRANSRRSLAATGSLDSLSEDPEEPAVFPKGDLPESYGAIMTLVERLAAAAHSPFPRLTERIAGLQRRQRMAFKAKEALIRNQLGSAAARFAAETAAGQERQVYCALDHILARVMEAARKAGKRPEYHTRVIYDEVRSRLTRLHSIASI